MKKFSRKLAIHQQVLATCTASESRIKVLIVQRVCAHYRIPLFARLAAVDDLHVHVCFGDGNRWTPGKIRTSRQEKAFLHVQLPTLAVGFPTPVGTLPVFFNPTLPLAAARFRPDVIVLEGESNLLNNLWLWPYLRLSQTPYVWWGLGKAPGRPPGRLRKVLQPVIGRWLRQAAAVMAYSSYGARDYVSRGAHKGRTYVVYNCLDTDKIAHDIRKFAPHVQEARQRLNLERKRVILFVGALEKSKNVELLLRAFRDLRRKREDVVLLLVGDGEHRSVLQKWVRHRQVRDVVFLGKHVEDASLYFLLGDVFVLPGLGGLAINHAMAHGKPVVASAADGTERDQIIDGYNGFLVPPDDKVALSRAIHEIICSPRLAETMGRRSKQLVDSKFNIQNTVARYAAAIRRTVGETEAQRGVLRS